MRDARYLKYLQTNPNVLKEAPTHIPFQSAPVVQQVVTMETISFPKNTRELSEELI